MHRALLLSLFAATVFAQTAGPKPASPQPPADVDRALRARINAFYGLLVNHQYRKAEEFVTPDSRDIYYEREKPRYLGFELATIEYSADFTHADVRVTVKMPPNGITLTIDMPAASIWQCIDGAWYWSIPKINVTDMLRSMTGGEGSSDAKMAGVPPPMPANMNMAAALPGTANLPGNVNLPGGMGRPDAIPAMGMGELTDPKFTFDRPQVVIKPSSTEKVTITSTSSSPMTLFLLGKLAGIEATFDHAVVNPGEKTVLSIQAAEGAKDGVLVIGVTETRAVASLNVSVR